MKFLPKLLVVSEVFQKFVLSMQNYMLHTMTNKGKYTDSGSYVKRRDSKRKAEKREVRRQLAEGDYIKIIELSGKSRSTVEKALNPNQQLWSQSVIDAARAYIQERDSKLAEA